MIVDRFAHPDRDCLVYSPIVPWEPTDPAPLSQSHLEAVDRYLRTDKETPRQLGTADVAH